MEKLCGKHLYGDDVGVIFADAHSKSLKIINIRTRLNPGLACNIFLFQKSGRQYRRKDPSQFCFITALKGVFVFTYLNQYNYTN